MTRPVLRHRVALAFIALTILVAALAISTQGLGYPSPVDARQPAPDIARRLGAERASAALHFSLICLDSVTRGRPAAAIRPCSLALDLDPKNASLLTLRATALTLTGKPGPAMADFDHAIAVDPRFVDAYRFRAVLNASLHRDSDALADYGHALGLSPGDALVLEARGAFYQSRGRYRAALADFSSAIAAQPGLARLWNSRCWTRMLANIDLPAALADCDHALRLDAASIDTLDSRGYVLLRLNRLTAAVESFNRALARSPNFASSLFGRGIARMRMRDANGIRDVAMARLIEPGIEARFARIGIRVPALGPPGA